MRRWWLIVPAVAVGLLSPSVRGAEADEPRRAAAPASAPQLAPYSEVAGAFLTRYCNACHSGAKPKADLNLTNYSDTESVLRGRKVWVRIKEAVEAGDMPPEGKPQPSEAEVSRLSDWIKGTLAQVDCTSQSNPGRVTIRRLNRAEYNNTIRDLVGIDFQPADDFPSDDVGYGFDNIGDVLTLPPILFEKYLQAAEKIAEQAIVAGPSAQQGQLKVWEAEDLPDSAGGGLFQDVGRVLASTGAVKVTHAFPRDAEYIVRARAFGQQAGPEVTRMAFQIDGKTLKVVDVPATQADPRLYEFRARLKGGTRTFGVAFLNDYYNEKATDPRQRDRNLVIDSLEIQGPIAVAGTALPESHRRIIFKTPGKDNQDEVARDILSRFAMRAYRRPVAPGEVARLAKFVDLAQQNGESFDRGIQLAVEAVLVSPQFLFRVELDQRPRRGDGSANNGSFLLNEFELASRLSYFLWSSMPDDELFRLALENKLRVGDNLTKQVRRMLRDPKARALVENFAGQWLQYRNLRTLNPDRGRFKSFDEPLRAAMMKETELYFESIMRDDRSILDLIDSDYTYVNERLARHYGIPGVKGDEFRRVKLNDANRGGVLTQASILTVTSNPTRTSPVKRGKWILEQILGTPPPPPPGEVPQLSDDRNAPLKGTLRQRMEQHRVNPACASCHARMDPLGFGFENFDAIGGWRDRDGDSPVDPSGVLPSGQKFAGPRELKAILKARKSDVTRCLAEKMLTYATGRGLEYYDSCALDQIVGRTAANGYRFSQLVLEIVKSDPFQKRKGRGTTP